MQLTSGRRQPRTDSERSSLFAEELASFHGFCFQSMFEESVFLGAQ